MLTFLYFFHEWDNLDIKKYTYLCGCKPLPSRERDSLSWVTSTERLFWKPVLVPVFHGSLVKKITNRKWEQCNMVLFILVRCEIDFVFGRYRRKLELFLSIQMSNQIITLCFIYLHTNLKLKNFWIFVKMQDYISVLYDPQLFCLLMKLQYSFFNLCTTNVK